MNKKHPLIIYSKENDIPFVEIAKKAGISRQSLYRIISGQQNARRETIIAISKATDGKVAIGAFFE